MPLLCTISFFLKKCKKEKKKIEVKRKVSVFWTRKKNEMWTTAPFSFLFTLQLLKEKLH